MERPPSSLGTSSPVPRGGHLAGQLLAGGALFCRGLVGLALLDSPHDLLRAHILLLNVVHDVVNVSDYVIRLGHHIWFRFIEPIVFILCLLVQPLLVDKQIPFKQLHGDQGSANPPDRIRQRAVNSNVLQADQQELLFPSAFSGNSDRPEISSWPSSYLSK